MHRSNSNDLGVLFFFCSQLWGSLILGWGVVVEERRRRKKKKNQVGTDKRTGTRGPQQGQISPLPFVGSSSRRAACVIPVSCYRSLFAGVGLSVFAQATCDSERYLAAVVPNQVSLGFRVGGRTIERMLCDLSSTCRAVALAALELVTMGFVFVLVGCFFFLFLFMQSFLASPLLIVNLSPRRPLFFDFV